MTGPPIAVQVIILLTIGVLIAQIVTGVLVTVLPPPRPPIYHLREVADALRGGPLLVAYGRRLERSVTAMPPPERSTRPGDDQSRQSLAILVGQPEAQVRFQDLGLSNSSRWVATALSPWRPPRLSGLRPPGQRAPGKHHGGLWRGLPGWGHVCPPGPGGRPGSPRRSRPAGAG